MSTKHEPKQRRKRRPEWRQDDEGKLTKWLREHATKGDRTRWRRLEGK